MFKPRYSKPEAGNKYYITLTAGGYSRARIGSPTDKDCNTLANCVGYAYGRYHEIAGRTAMDLFDPVNAENIFANAKQHGLKTGSTPALGALIVWQKGATLSGSDGAGHVAVVEEIGVGGDITTSESGFNAKRPFWNGHYKAPYKYKDGYTFLGFVYQPDVVNPDTTQRALRKGDKGSDVKEMQTKLAVKGYMRSAEIDGYFGVITLGAVLAFQFENDLTVDGVCGKQTMAALFW